MAYLRNCNGSNYKILGSRRCESNPKHKDYLVQEDKTGVIYVAHCWWPKHKCWGNSDYYGKGPGALKMAKQDFYADKIKKYE